MYVKHGKFQLESIFGAVQCSLLYRIHINQTIRYFVQIASIFLREVAKHGWNTPCYTKYANMSISSYNIYS